MTCTKAAWTLMLTLLLGPAVSSAKGERAFVQHAT
jgi:hypothetical protein